MSSARPRASIAIRRAANFLAVVAVGALACGASDPLEEVRRLQNAGNYAATIEPLRELIEERPDDPEVHYRYGAALVSTGRGDVAVWPLRKAMGFTEWRRDAGLLLATGMLGSGDYDGAVEVCGELLELDPDDVDALRLRAGARAASRRNYEGALEDANRALELDPDDTNALVPRTVALLALERVEEAAAALEELDARFRDDSLEVAGSPLLCVALATFAREKGEIELADERFDGCLEAFPGDAAVLNQALPHYEQTGRPERAIEALEAALKLLPTAHAYRANLALRLRGAGREDEALELLRAATELSAPADVAEAWASLAGFLVDGGQFDEGAAAYERALEVLSDPPPQLLFSYGDALALAERYDEALAVADRMELPAHRELVRGLVHLERGDPAAALEHLEEGLLLWPDNAVARYYAAVAAERTGDFGLAIEHYRYAIRADQEATDAALRLARIHLAAGDEAEAIAALGRSPTSGPMRLEAGLLQLELASRRGQLRPPPALVRLFSERDLWGRAAAARARGIYARRGAAGAVAFLNQAGRLDLTDPRDVAALEVLLDWLAESNAAGKGLERVEEAVAAHPQEAVFHALQGRALAAAAADPEAVRAAYERALAIDAAEPHALGGLARLEAQAGEAERAVSLYERALEAEPDDRELVLPLSELLIVQGQRDAAEARLEALLREQPWDASAALALARLRLERGTADARTLELARRAVHFRGGPEAEALVERVGAAAPALRSGGAKPALSPPR